MLAFTQLNEFYEQTLGGAQVSPGPSSPSPGLECAHPEQLLGQVSPIVDAAIHGDEPLHGGLIFDVGVVQAGVQHDDGKREHVTSI